MKSPSRWDELSKADKAEMMSDYLTDMAMESWEDHYQGQQMEKARLKSKRGLK